MGVDRKDWFHSMGERLTQKIRFTQGRKGLGMMVGAEKIRLKIVAGSKDSFHAQCRKGLWSWLAQKDLFHAMGEWGLTQRLVSRNGRKADSKDSFHAM